MTSKNTVSGDDRFSKIKKDPRFWEMPNKERKVKIDKRFQSMFHDQRFKLKYTVDKRGRPISYTSSEDLKRFYKVSDSEQSDEEQEDGTEKEKKEEFQLQSDESEEEEEAEKLLKTEKAKKTKEPSMKGARVFEEGTAAETFLTGFIFVVVDLIYVTIATLLFWISHLKVILTRMLLYILLKTE